MGVVRVKNEWSMFGKGSAFVGLKAKLCFAKTTIIKKFILYLYQ